MPLGRKADLMRDIMSAWRAIANGIVAKNTSTWEKYWAHWENYCAAFQLHPHLIDCNTEKIIITAYAARVRTGHYGNKRQVKVLSIQDVLSAISKTIELAGELSPIYKAEKTYKAPVTRLVEGM
jgi:hypothetical protein